MATGGIILKNFKGVRLDLEPRELEDDDLALSLNMIAQKNGLLTLRPNVETFALLRTAPDVRDAIVIPYVDTDNKKRLFMWLTDEAKHYAFYMDSVEETVRNVSATADFFDAGGVTRPAHITWLNKLWVFTNSSRRGFIVSTRAADNTLNVTALNTVWLTNPPTPVGAWIYRSTLMLIERDGLVRNCEIKDPTVLVDTAKSFPVGQGDGDEGVSGIEVTVEGGESALEPYSLVFKRRSTWMLQGSPPTTTDTGSLKLTQLLPDQGCVAKETIVKTKYGVVWCTGETVYLAAPGKTPVEVGAAIAPMLRDTTQGPDGPWSACYDDGFYRLSIPRNSWNTPRESDGVTFPDREEWWLDLRNFPETHTWWGPQQVPIISAANLQVADGTRELYALTFHVEAAGKGIYLARANTLRQGRKDKVHLFEAAPTAELVFKEFDFGDPMLRKIIHGVEVHARVELASSMVMELRGEGGMIVMSHAEDVAPHGFVLGSNQSIYEGPGQGSATVQGDSMSVILATMNAILADVSAIRARLWRYSGTARHGDVIVFPTPATTIPKIKIFPMRAAMEQGSGLLWSGEVGAPAYNANEMKRYDLGGDNVSLTGFTVRARLFQRGTPVLVQRQLDQDAWGTFNAIGHTRAMVLTTHPPAPSGGPYIGNLDATANFQNASPGNPMTGDLIYTFVHEKSIDSGGSWTTVDTFTRTFNPGGSTSVENNQNDNGFITSHTDAAFGAGDKFRLRISAINSAGLSGVSSFSLTTANLTIWYEESVTDHLYASATPHADDNVYYEATLD